MKTSKRDRMYQQIEAHGQNLLAIYPGATERDPVKLCKKLHRLESQASALATHYCNGTGGINTDNWEEKTAPTLARVQKILGDGPAVFINGDARGYALKINEETVRDMGLKIYTDWGGYGIICPEFNGE
jgi:hypothetical protein